MACCGFRKEAEGRLEEATTGLRGMRRCPLSKASKLTKEQKVQIALDLLAGKLSVSEICRKYEISATYAYKIRDRAIEILRANIDKTSSQPDGEVRALRKKVSDLEELAGDQALVIRALKKTQNHEE